MSLDPPNRFFSWDRLLQAGPSGKVNVQEQRFCLRIKTAILRTKALRGVYPPCRRRRTAGGVYPPIVVWWGGFTPHVVVVQGGGFTPCSVAGCPSIPPPACRSHIFLTSPTPPNCTLLLLTAPGLPPQRRRRTLGGVYPPQLYIVVGLPRLTPPM